MTSFASGRLSCQLAIAPSQHACVRVVAKTLSEIFDWNWAIHLMYPKSSSTSGLNFAPG